MTINLPLARTVSAATKNGGYESLLAVTGWGLYRLVANRQRHYDLCFRYLLLPRAHLCIWDFDTSFSDLLFQLLNSTCLQLVLRLLGVADQLKQHQLCQSSCLTQSQGMSFVCSLPSKSLLLQAPTHEKKKKNAFSFKMLIEEVIITVLLGFGT